MKGNNAPRCKRVVNASVFIFGKFVSSQNQDAMNITEEEKVKDLLRGIQLDQYYRQIHGKLHVTRLSHFDHVTEGDLDDLGMAKPEQRRLLEALKKAKKKSIFSSFRRKKSNKAEQRTETADRISCYGDAGDNLTCVINEHAVSLYEMLGNGAFGYVRRGTWMKDAHKKINVAVKCLKSWSDEAFHQMQMDFIKEANALSLLDHPHIIRLHGVVLSVPMMMVTELASLGCLLTRLRDEPHNFTVSSLSDFVVQIASGMAYLELHRFVHRDLAARNLLLDSYERVKIGDFGMMRVLSGDQDHYTMHPSGKIPFAWCPQEVLKYRKFSHASDVWAFGITVLELFSYGMEPWPGLNGAEVEKILEKVDMPVCDRPKIPDHCPPEIYSILLSHCWAHEPHQRARFVALRKTMEEVHPLNASAVFPYESKCQQNLSFQEGDIVTLLEAKVSLPVEREEKRLWEKAVSPVKNKSSPKARSPVKQLSSRPSCDCGSVHAYETPVMFPSDLSVMSSSRSSSQSSRSSESNLTSSVECDSGYSSSVDTRRFRLSNGDDSPVQRKANLEASYENTEPRRPCAGKQDIQPVYELMCPATGAVSSPIPIPRPGSGEARYVRKHCSPSTPRRAVEKCPLDFSSSFDEQNSVNKAEPPTLLPPGQNDKWRADSDIGGSFVKDTLTLVEKVDVETSGMADVSAKNEEDDIYVELSTPCVPFGSAPGIDSIGSPSSRSQRSLQREHLYENHAIPGRDDISGSMVSGEREHQRVKCSSGQLSHGNEEPRAWTRCHTWPSKQGDEGADSLSASCCYDNHKLKVAVTDSPRSSSQYDNCKIRNEKCDCTNDSPEARVWRRRVSESVDRHYENVELNVGEPSEVLYENVALSHETVAEQKECSSGDGNQKTVTVSPCYENVTPRGPQDGAAESGVNSTSELFYENWPIQDTKERSVSEEIPGVVVAGLIEETRCQVPGGVSSSLPTNRTSLRLASGEEIESPTMMAVKRIRRSNSADAIRRDSMCEDHASSNVRPSSLPCGSDIGPESDCDERPIPPPRWKRIARMNQTRSVNLTPERASVMLKRLKITEGASPEVEASVDNPSLNCAPPQRADTKKPSLLPEAKGNRATAFNNGTPSSRGRHAHDNAKASGIASVNQSDVSVNQSELSVELNAPKLPPKVHAANKATCSNQRLSRPKAAQYENVTIMAGNTIVSPELVDDTIPPLPRKLSRSKSPPVIPPRFGLEPK